MKTKLLLLSVISCLAIACIPPSQSRIFPEYQSFGDANPTKDELIKGKFGRGLAKVPDAKVRVLIETLPEGITVGESGLSVQDGYEHQILGKFSFTNRDPAYSSMSIYSYKKLPKTIVVDHIRRFTQAAGGNLAVAAYTSLGPRGTIGAAGYIIKVDPKLDPKALKTRKAKIKTKDL